MSDSVRDGCAVMDTTGRVVSVDGATAKIEVERNSACAGCHKAESGCALFAMNGKAAVMKADALNTAGAAPGDTVRVAARSRRMLFYAAALFIAPLAAAGAAYSAAAFAFGQSEPVSLAAAAAGFAAVFAAAAIYSRHRSRTVPDLEITEIITKAKDDNVQSR